MISNRKELRHVIAFSLEEEMSDETVASFMQQFVDLVFDDDAVFFKEAEFPEFRVVDLRRLETVDWKRRKIHGFVHMIKEVRGITGMGLKETKEFCEQVRDKFDLETV